MLLPRNNNDNNNFTKIMQLRTLAEALLVFDNLVIDHTISNFFYLKLFVNMKSNNIFLHTAERERKYPLVKIIKECLFSESRKLFPHKCHSPS